jgi:hypothetical protein
MTVADTTLETVDREVTAARWDRAERDQIAADLAATAAAKARIAAAKGVAAETGARAWEVENHPTVAALVEREMAAARAEAEANRALIATPASDWRAWVVKLELVRTYIDGAIDPLDHASRKMLRERPKSFPGSRRLLDAHHYALALYARVTDAGANRSRITKLLLQACAELGIVPSTVDETAVPAFGLAMLAADAERLNAEKGGAQ